MHNSASAACAVKAVVEDIAREAGKLALTYFQSLASLPVEKKGHLDLVTEADKQVEELLIARLQEAFPDDGIFGEEGGETPEPPVVSGLSIQSTGHSTSSGAARTGRFPSVFTKAVGRYSE